MELADLSVEQGLVREILDDAALTVSQERAPKAEHGREEVRTLWALRSSELNRHAGSEGSVGKPWPDLEQVLRIQRVILDKDPKSGEWRTTTEVDYGITSLLPERADAGALRVRWRAHWGIEALHWVRDVTLGEDASQVHTGQIPEAFSVLRNGVVTLLKLAGEPSVAAGVRALGTDPPAVLELFATLTNRVQKGLRCSRTVGGERKPGVTS